MDIARVAVALTVIVGGVLHATGVAVASGVAVALLDFPVFFTARRRGVDLQKLAWAESPFGAESKKGPQAPPPSLYAGEPGISQS